MSDEIRFVYNNTEVCVGSSKFALISWYCDLLEQTGTTSVLFPEIEDDFICMISSAIERETGKSINVPNISFDNQCDYLFDCLQSYELIKVL